MGLLELIKLEGKHNISEIADITGFSTLSHFLCKFQEMFWRTNAVDCKQYSTLLRLTLNKSSMSENASLRNCQSFDPVSPELLLNSYETHNYN